MANAAPSFQRRKAQLTALALEGGVSEGDLLKLRAVLLFLALPHGSKLVKAPKIVSGLKTRGLKASLRSLYMWREAYLRSGFAGIVRRRRRDRGRSHAFGEDVLLRIVDAVTRIRWHGDITREYGAFKDTMSRESFRVWVHRFQKRFRLVEMPRREESVGLIF